MSDYTATVKWQRRSGEPFVDNRYARRHEWQFDGGVTVPASSSPHVVKVPLSDPAAVDPEEAFVASVASCHMLWFLSLAANRRFVIESYVDQAVGTMARGPDGRMMMARVTLRPVVRFGGDAQPSPADVHALHEAAHHECFIANSVKTEIVVDESA